MHRDPTYVVDGEVKRFDESQTAFERSESHFSLTQSQGGKAVYDAFFSTTTALGAPQYVDGEPSPESAAGTPDENSRRIQRFALMAGAAEVRVAPLRPEWVYLPKAGAADHDLPNVAALAAVQLAR